MPRVDALTSLRFIAALVVFLHHWILTNGYVFWDGNYREDRLGRIIYEMRFGVTLFFVLSGFLMGAKYFDTIFTKVSFRDYWIKRFARVMPLYWFLLGVLALYYIIPQYLPEKVWGWIANYHAYETQYDPVHMRFLYFDVYITLTQAFFKNLKFTGIGVAWSLTVEECFYLTLPFVILAIRWLWKATFLKDVRVGKVSIPAEVWRYLLVIAILIGFTVVFEQMGRALYSGKHEIRSAVLSHINLDRVGFFAEKSDWWIYTIFGRFFDFAVGIFFGVLYKKSSNWFLRRGWRADLAILACTVAIVIVCNKIGRRDGLETEEGFTLNGINAFLSAVIIYCLCSARSYAAKALNWRPFVYLGEISFALYLVHTHVLVDWYLDYLKESGASMLVTILAPYLLCTILSIICYEGVERPAQHLILSKWFGDTGSKRPTVLRWLLGKPQRNLQQPAAA